MTTRIEKTVFISYRRTNVSWALAIYQNLVSRGYDIFFDYKSINSGDFEQIILGNLRARAHFLVILTPTALERCNEPGDWLRREIETAIDEKRNIVPLFLEGFSFGDAAISQYLTGKLRLLRDYNGLNVPSDYFDEAMDKLAGRFLAVPLDAVLHPLSDSAQKGAEAVKAAIHKELGGMDHELSAEEWFAEGNKQWQAGSYRKAIQCFTETIQRRPRYAPAYVNRGTMFEAIGDLDHALDDFDQALNITPNNNAVKLKIAHIHSEKTLQKWQRGRKL